MVGSTKLSLPDVRKNKVKRMNRPFLCIFLLASFLLSGCQPDLPPLPDIGVPANILNKDLDIFFMPSRENTFKIGDEIVLDVHLKSDIQVKVNENFNEQMYLLDKINHQ